MKLPQWFIFIFCGTGAVAMAQTPWPSVQARNYPVAKGLELFRHEQSILLGEGEQQTGLFFANQSKANSHEVQAELVQDAQRKGWRLQTALRQGTYHVSTFHKGQRLLDIRLIHANEGVEAVYSVALIQQIETLPVVAPFPSSRAVQTGPKAR